MPSSKSNVFLTDKKDIEAWLKKYKIKNYTLVPDPNYVFAVDVVGNVDLSHKNLDFLPVKFNKVSGYFYIEENNLTSLEGSPHTVDGIFDCCHNKLKTLLHAPSQVGQTFTCGNNELVSLVGSPNVFDGVYYCANNKLKNLEGVPPVLHELDCSNNLITSALFCPQKCSYLQFGDNPIYDKNERKIEQLEESEDYNGDDLNFTFFYKEHLKEKIKNDKKKLEKAIKVQPTLLIKSTYKI